MPRPKKTEQVQAPRPVVGAPQGSYAPPKPKSEIPEPTTRENTVIEGTRPSTPPKKQKEKEPEWPVPVEKPAAPLSEIKVSRSEDAPKRHPRRIEDPWPDLPERTRAYLKLHPHGGNIVIDRRRIAKLQDYFLRIKELPLPDTVWKTLNEMQNEVRNIIELISIEEWETEWSQRLKEGWEPMMPNFTCKCHTRKRRSSSSSKKKQTEEDDE